MILLKHIIAEAKVKVPDYIISNIPASKIEPTRIALADVSLGLKMAEELKNWTLKKDHYSLVHHNGKVALKLTPKGKLAIKVRSEKNPDYLKLLQTTIDMLLKQHADKIAKTKSIQEENEPTNPELWNRAIAAAKAKYDVYPSAYANAFASKWYKEKGGDWKTKKESIK